MPTSPLPASVIADATAAAQTWLRGGGTTEPALLATLTRTAIELAEAFTGGPLITRTCEDVLPARSTWQALAAAPVSAIAGVTALTPGAAPTIVTVDAYAIDIDPDGRGWVRLTSSIAAPQIAVDYTAGIAPDWVALPAPLAQGVAMLVGQLFDNRVTDTAPPAAVTALWRPWRRQRMGPTGLTAPSPGQWPGASGPYQGPFW